MVDGKIEVKAKNRVRTSTRTRNKAKASPKSRLEKFRIVKSNTLGASLPYVIVPLGAKSVSGLLEIVESYKDFFW